MAEIATKQQRDNWHRLMAHCVSGEPLQPHQYAHRQLSGPAFVVPLALRDMAKELADYHEQRMRRELTETLFHA